MNNCKCCNEVVALNFCPNCGQRKAKRIDAQYLKDELQYTLLHTNKGFFYSIKKIMKAPGQTAAEFIEGNRIHHYKPILMVFLLSGISAFLTNTFIHPVDIITRYYEIHKADNAQLSIGAFGFIMKYSSLVMLLNVPIFAVFSWLAFKKWGYNYYESVIASAYLLSAVMVFSIIIGFPVQFAFRHDPDMYMLVSTVVSYLIMFGVTVWFYIDLYRDKASGKVILRTIAMFVSLFVTIFVITIIMVIVYFLMNPDAIPKG